MSKFKLLIAKPFRSDKGNLRALLKQFSVSKLNEVSAADWQECAQLAQKLSPKDLTAILSDSGMWAQEQPLWIELVAHLPQPILEKEVDRLPVETFLTVAAFEDKPLEGRKLLTRLPELVQARHSEYIGKLHNELEAKNAEQKRTIIRRRRSKTPKL